MPTKRTGATAVADRFDRIETILERVVEEARNTNGRIDRLIEDQESFRQTVRGAFLTQQEQIAELFRGIAELKQAQAETSRQWAAYLSTIHPKQ
jgi:hypothetical protein